MERHCWQRLGRWGVGLFALLTLFMGASPARATSIIASDVKATHPGAVENSLESTGFRFSWWMSTSTGVHENAKPLADYSKVCSSTGGTPCGIGSSLGPAEFALPMPASFGSVNEGVQTFDEPSGGETRYFILITVILVGMIGYYTSQDSSEFFLKILKDGEYDSDYDY